MLFQRRQPATWREKVRNWIWPRRSWSRSVKYIAKRILRLSASPHAIAAGVAAGVFVSFTPYIGIHTITSIVICLVIRGNIIAASLATLFGNPLTFPLIWVMTYKTGMFFLYGMGHGNDPAHKVMEPITALESLARVDVFQQGLSGLGQILHDLWQPILLPMTLGSIPLGLGFATIFYAITLWAATMFRAKRSRIIAERAANRIA